MNQDPTGRSEAAGSTLSNNGTGPGHLSIPPGDQIASGESAPASSLASPEHSGTDSPLAEEPSTATQATTSRSGRHELLGSLREVAETVVLALLFFFALRALVQNFRVEGSSMFPNFADGQYVLVNKAVYSHVGSGTLPGWVPFLGGSTGSARYLFHEPRRGDVIVFHPPPPNDPSRDFIKRVIGVPGDTVDVREGHVFVNGAELNEPYIHQATLPFGGRFAHVTLGPDQYYVLGDNRGNSSDSRAWGPVRADEIVGRTWLVYWPLSAWRVAPNHAEQVPAPGASSP